MSFLPQGNRVIFRAMQVCVFPYSSWSLAALEDAAKPWMPHGTKRRLGNEERRRAHFAGRVAAAHALKNAGKRGFIVPDPQWGYLTFEPTRSEPRDVPTFINISHTAEIAVAASCHSPVGVDIEATDRDASRVLQRVLSKSEKPLLQKKMLTVANNEAVPIGIAFWSAKEAYSKALGLGIKFGMRDLEIGFAGTSPFRVSSRLRGPLSLVQPAVILFRHHDYLISICSEEDALHPITFSVHH